MTSYMGYDIVHKSSHYEVYLNGVFQFSDDTIDLCMDEIKTIEGGKKNV